MSSSSALPKKLVIFAIILPLAGFVGYLLSSPDFESLALVGLLAALLSIPLFLAAHHAILIATLNLSMTLFFLPGNPPVWMMAAAISLGMTLVNRILDKQKKLLGDPGMSWSLLALGLVVLFTMKMTTGLGLMAFGSAYYGGRKYVFILAAIIAYFALSTQAMPVAKIKSRLATYFLTGVTPIMSHIIYALGPGMWILYALFSVDYAIGQAVEDLNSPLLLAKLGRLAGLTPAGLAVFCFLLARFGVQGVLDWTRPWRFLILATAVTFSLLGGFRSIIVLIAAVVVIQFFLEGLHKTRLMGIVLVSAAIVTAIIIPTARKLPMPIQRCLTVFPLDVDAAARLDAKASTEWRLEMWKILAAQIPKYLWVGKGCGANATDHYLAYESFRRGLTGDTELFMLSGDYHNGPLSVIIPFGIPGALAFLWFLGSAIRVLWRNYRHGDPELRTVNTFFLAYFLAKTAFFMTLFGAIHSDLITLASLVGLSISVNGGVRKPAVVPVRSVAPSASNESLSLRPAGA